MKLLNGFNNGRDTTDGIGGDSGPFDIKLSEDTEVQQREIECQLISSLHQNIEIKTFNWVDRKKEDIYFNNYEFIIIENKGELELKFCEFNRKGEIVTTGKSHMSLIRP